MNYMKLLMDADCLIKLVRAGLKDLVGNKYTIFIPKQIFYSGKNNIQLKQGVITP